MWDTYDALIANHTTRANHTTTAGQCKDSRTCEPYSSRPHVRTVGLTHVGVWGNVG
jgi:hypothetical protein